MHRNFFTHRWLDWLHTYRQNLCNGQTDKFGWFFATFFVGISEQTERFATGLMSAVEKALKVMIDDPNLLLRKISSVCTDGTNVNTGDKNSLWVLLEKETKEAGSKIPLNKIWCGAHRAELAWKNTAKTVGEVAKKLSVLSFSLYGHSRSSAGKHCLNHCVNLRLLILPKIFEIRWSQFTFDLARSVLVSWEALVIYFEENKKDADCAGYLNFLTKLETVQLIAFLADVLFVFSRFQKKLQSDDLTLISMKAHTTVVVTTLNGIRSVSLLGGFESNLETQWTREPDDKIFLKSFELQQRKNVNSRRARATKSFTDVRTNILDALCKFLTERFDIDQQLLEKNLAVCQF